MKLFKSNIKKQPIGITFDNLFGKNILQWRVRKYTDNEHIAD